MFTPLSHLSGRIKKRISGLAPHRRAKLAEGAGWAIFLAVLVWFYRIPPWMWATYMPYGAGDMLEALWQIDFWRRAVLTRELQPVITSAMYPLGMHVMTIAHNGVGFLLLPISLIAGSAVALNAGFVGMLILCFLGARHFLRQLTPSALLASIGATVFTFALGRTAHIHFHFNVALASAFGVWMGGLLLALRRQAGSPRAWTYALGSGLLWGAAIISQPYAIFWGSLLLLLLGREWRAWKHVPIIGMSALAVSAPLLFGLLQGTAYMSSREPSLLLLARFESSPASFIGWGRSGWRFLVDFTRSWRPLLPEQYVQNWGVLIAVLTVVGIATLWRDRHIRTMVILLIVSAILSFGPLWENPPVGADIAGRINSHLWQIGRRLKPGVFDAGSEDLKTRSLPLPGMVPLIVVPRYEFARASGRYSIWVGLAAVAIAIAALNRLPKGSAIAVGCLWILELLPLPLPPGVIPTQPHPAHEWAAARLNNLDDLGVYSPSGISYIYSHLLADELPATSTMGPFEPAYIRYSYPWIPYDDLPTVALTDPAHAVILRRAQVGIVLLRPRAAALAQQNSALRFVQCFEPDPVKLSYYRDPLCAFEVLPDEDDFFTIQPVSGFSYFEPNSVWIEGTQAKAGWRVTRPTTHTIEVALRAYCPSESRQSVVIRLNGQLVMSHTWPGNCWDRWTATLTIPPEQIAAGWNTLEFEAASAAQPYLHDPNNKDQRNLSVLVEQLRVSSANSMRHSRSITAPDDAEAPLGATSSTQSAHANVDLKSLTRKTYLLAIMR